MRRARYADAEVHRWVTVGEIKREIGPMHWRQAHKLIDQAQRLGLPPLRRSASGATLYHADIIEMLRGLLGQPHRSLEGPEQDWLSRYLQLSEDPCQAETRGTPDQGEGTPT